MVREHLMEKLLHLVGKKFSQFLSNKEVSSVEEFIKKRMDTNEASKDVIYKLGQGCSAYEINRLMPESIDANLAKTFVKETKEFVHKKDEKNVMITKPCLIEKDYYKAFLMLDNECAEMSDHITGQHIQGMVVIEAARQMMLSVTENYFLTKEQQGKMWVILNEINTTFLAFLFPLEVEIYYRAEVIKNNDTKSKHKAEVSFIQNEKLAAKINISFSVYEQEWLERHEQNLAQQAIKECGKKYTENSI